MAIKTLKFEATLGLDDSYIGWTDQERNYFWDQVREHSVLHINGDLGEGVGVFSDICVSTPD